MATGIADAEQVFIIEYWRTMSAARAYRTAFDIPSEVSCRGPGEALLQAKHIRKALDSYRSNLRTNQAMLRERLIEELTRIATFNPANIYDEQGAMLPPHRMDPEDAACLAGLETIELIDKPGEAPTGHIRKVKWLDKLNAIKLLMQAQGWNVEAQADAPAASPLRALLEQMSGRSAIPIVLDHEAEP